MMLFLFMLLITMNNSLGLEPQTSRWPCGLNRCICSNTSTEETNENTATAGISAVCFMKTLTSYDTVSLSLLSDLTSLTLSCILENGTSLLKEKMFARHKKIQTLVFEKCNIRHIDPNFASGLGSLAEISFRENVLPVFARDAFSSCSSLTSLTIVHSKLTNFPFFQELKNIQILNLSQNRLKSPEIIVSENDILIDLVHVNFSYNGIKEIPSNFFSVSPILKNVYLQGNVIIRLSVPSNITLNYLEQFDASGNPLQLIDFESLTSSENLTQFKVKGINTTPLILTKSISLPNLIDLKLSNFQINNSIWDLLNTPSLVKLDLSSNLLNEVNLNKLPYLQKIYLQENSISELSPTTFISQQNLLVLNISHNHISQIHESLFESNFLLKAVIMNGNRVSSLSSQVFHSNPEIFYIDVSNNSITRLPYGIFSKVPNLLYLYLQRNRLKFLPNLSNLHVLHLLDISYNQFGFLTANSFRGLKSIQFLIVNNNKINALPNGILTPCPNLLEANFNDNKIQFVGSFENHPRLLTLQLQNNTLKDFPSRSPFAGMKSLAFIFLDGNKFTSITPNMFPSTIEIISMTDNDIFYLLHASLDNMPRLSLVNFMMSRKVMQIPQFSVQKYAPGSMKPSIYLGFNNLACNCRLAYLKVWYERRHQIPSLLERFPTFSGLDTAACVSPLSPNKLSFFKDEPLSNFVCEYNESTCFIAECDCCLADDIASCPCSMTCPSQCTCYEGGSGYWERYVHIDCKSRNLSRIPNLIPSLANFVYLQGNNIKTINKNQFFHMTHAQTLILNNSRVESIEDGTFDGMTSIETIRLDGNLITKINRDTFGNISTLLYLDMSYNQITIIDSEAFDGLINLHTLHLDNNKLMFLNNQLHDLPKLQRLTLAFNPWSCECDVIENLATYVTRRANQKIIEDKNSICCLHDSVISHEVFLFTIQNNSIPVLREKLKNSLDHSGIKSLGQTTNKDTNDNKVSIYSAAQIDTSSSQYTSSYITTSQQSQNLNLNVSCYSLASFDFERVCEAISNTTNHIIIISRSSSHGADVNPAIIVVLIIAATILFLLALFLILFTWRRSELQAFLLAKTGVRIWDKKASLDKQDEGTKPFDAFISYSQKDHDYVCNTLVPGMEKKGYRVCVHYRDFPVGGEISAVIKRAIHLSSRTVLIVSSHQLKSSWCRYEFQTAHHHILKEGSHRLILVLMEEIPESQMDPDFRSHMKANTYLKAQDVWFWEKLNFALPDISNRKYNKESGEAEYLSMRGMRILSGEEGYDNVGMKMDEEEKEDKEEEGEKKEVVVKYQDGGSKGDGRNREKEKGKIDWKKEEERIMSERRKKEEELEKEKGVYTTSEKDIGVGWGM